MLEILFGACHPLARVLRRSGLVRQRPQCNRYDRRAARRIWSRPGWSLSSLSLSQDERLDVPYRSSCERLHSDHLRTRKPEALRYLASTSKPLSRSNTSCLLACLMTSQEVKPGDDISTVCPWVEAIDR